MRNPVVLLLPLSLVFAGCLVDGGELVEPARMVVHYEPSMLPDFGKDAGPSFRMLQIHQHVMRSPAEEREWNDPNRPRVVCFRLDGVTPSELMSADSGSSSDMAAASICRPTLDPGRGRLFVDHDAFVKQAPMAVAVFDPCSGEIVPIDSAEPGIVVSAPGHAFRAEFLANDTLVVDGTWHVAPGKTLKIDYVAQGPRPGGDDDRPVKVVFDYAGFWLVSNVGVYDPNEGTPPPRPVEGNGPQAWIPRQPRLLTDVLDPLAAASPNGTSELLALRLAGLNMRLTDVRVTLGGAENTEWFVAGGNETHLKMLGLVEVPSMESDVPLKDFKAAFGSFEVTANMGAAGPSNAVEIRWQSDLAFKSRMPLAWSETWVPQTGSCQSGCSFVWTATPTEPAGWRLIQNPQAVKAEHAMTLSVSEMRDGAMFARLVLHKP
jgi:hypothetical protein